MKRVELLAPVGNMEMLYQAINYGADAVYLAGSNYGARRYARNFTNEELVDAIEYAHLYGVKVYVTVNIIIYENELDDVIEYIDFLYRHQVDALIMQDIGFISLVRRIFPNMEIHASTQCHNHNKGSLELFKNLGVTRVVMDRELSIDEIKNIDVDIEKEIFIYGALCVCYSGCCLFSSLNGGRSGNRGECAQCCRLPYKKRKDGKYQYLLSTKDLNALNYLGEYIDAGINCFKIEGRMKSPSYVGYVTKCARRIIDAYYNGKKECLSDEEVINLKKLFYRGFTQGYLNNAVSIMNVDSPNHQGIVIGEVVSVNHNRVKIKISNDYLSQGDGIRFKNADVGMMVNYLYDNKGLLVKEVLCGEYVSVEVSDRVKVGDLVLKTVDFKLQESIVNSEEKKIPVNFMVCAKIGEELKIEINDGVNTFIVVGDIVEKAVKAKVSFDDFKNKLSKLGNTPFVFSSISFDSDDSVFVRLSSINEMRRKLVSQLIDARKHKIVHKVSYGNVDKSDGIISNNVCRNISVLVRNEEQLKTCLSYDVSIYVTDYELYLKYKNMGNVYYRVSRVNMNMVDYKDEKLLVGDLGSAYLYSKNNEVIGDYYLNVVNHYSACYLNSFPLKRITLSAEMQYNQIVDMMRYVDDVNSIEMIVYGKFELMVMKNKFEDKDFMIENRSGDKFRIIRDGDVTKIIQDKGIDFINDIGKYQKIGIGNFRIELFDEIKEEVEDILMRVI